MKIRILSVSVGRPAPLGTWNNRPVSSGIVKHIVLDDHIFVGSTNLDGDEQADLRVHGGVDKAIYAYPSEHWAWWESVQGLACSAATFGENLTLAGADETQVTIGDRFRWGAAELEVSQPRAPCFKLGMLTQRPDVPQLMTVSGRCGWYFRVCVGGLVPVNGVDLERTHEANGPTVRECFAAALHPEVGRAERQRVASAPKLSAAWQETMQRRLL